ncbi:MAG: hydroxyacylglutathione hydrolase [Alphaproteobacteria bacterium]|jgi:hydroxyacylglutathione hydrolase
MVRPNVYLFPQLEDNYGYLIKNPHATEGVLIDPSDLEMCLKILELNDCSPTHILLTHHHDDHIAAVQDLKNKFQSIIIGFEHDEKIPQPDLRVKDDEIFEIHQNKFKVIHTPGHTLQHINYFMPEHNILFSGDTLFSMGCGRMFEGTPEVFWQSLSKIKQLPDNTTIYCGHEYTLSNVKFALSIHPENQDLQKYALWTEHQEKEHRPTIPTKLIDQLKCNPFLQCDSPHFQELYKSTDATEVFGKMRKAKDNF